MYNITLTHDRAMGNAYAVYTPSIDDKPQTTTEN